MKCGAELLLLLLLGLLSLGRSAPLSDCDSLVKPITISSEQMLGKWLYIGGSTNLPGSRSVGHLLKSTWLNVSATGQSNILNIIQTQRILGSCSSLIYNVTFENSTLLIEEKFHLKEVYLPTDCSDCLVVYEEIVSGADTFISLLLFSKSQTVSTPVLETLKRQAQCLYLPTPIILDTDYEICPDNIPPTEGLNVINTILDNKMGHRVASVLDKFFDLFVN